MLCGCGTVPAGRDHHHGSPTATASLSVSADGVMPATRLADPTSLAPPAQFAAMGSVASDLPQRYAPPIYRVLHFRTKKYEKSEMFFVKEGYLFPERARVWKKVAFFHEEKYF